LYQIIKSNQIYLQIYLQAHKKTMQHQYLPTCSDLMRKITTISTMLAGLKDSWEQLLHEPKKKKKGKQTQPKTIQLVL